MDSGECKSPEDPRSTSTSPPYSDTPQHEWELDCGADYAEDLPYQSPSIWNHSTPLPSSGREEAAGDRLVLCTICHKSLVPVQEVLLVGRKKRKRQEDLPVLSTMTVCQDCRMMAPDQLRGISVPEKSKRVVKRERAKNRVLESENAALNQLREKQLEALEKNPDLPEVEKRRMQQMVRNRISAQQSRDRKKVYLQQIEAVNDDLMAENGQLREKIAGLEQENQYLRSQLERYMTTPGSSGLGLVTGVMFGLAAVMMVVMVAMPYQSSSELALPQHRILSEVTSVMEYRGGNPVPDLPAVPTVQSVDSEQPLYPSTLSSIRQEAVDWLTTSQQRFLPDTPPDPCKAALLHDLRQRPDTLTTMYCPVVQLHWGSEDTETLDYLQILTPAESLPLTFADSIAKENYLMELICKVTDVRIVHNEG